MNIVEGIIIENPTTEINPEEVQQKDMNVATIVATRATLREIIGCSNKGNSKIVTKQCSYYRFTWR